MLAGLSNLIARETRGISYRTQKYSLDDSESSDADNDPLTVWEHPAESTHKQRYINLESLAQSLARHDEQILTYFLDGSRRVYKVDEIAYELSGGRRAIYPVIAGQIITGCCRRVNRKLTPERWKYEIVIALPEIADYDNNGNRGFWQGLAQKLSVGLEDTLRDATQPGLEISAMLHYSVDRYSRGTSYEDKATAAIQTRMMNDEQELTEYLTRKKLLNHANYLVKDGSLEYRQKSSIPAHNYRWVIGLSKRFNPEACMNINGKPDAGYIADLPLYHRTQAACYSRPEILGDAKFAVWYIRLHDRARTRSAFDGVVKAEKMLVTQSERDSGMMNSGEIDTLSAYIINERCPVCHGRDSRWANHIYPVFLTESFIKTKYLSTESFISLF